MNEKKSRPGEASHGDENGTLPIASMAGWLGAAGRVLDALFYDQPGKFSRFVRSAWMVGLLLLGGYLWGIFFSWGDISFDFLDWAEVTGPRYALLQDAMQKGQIPLHAENTTALRGVTDRYFSIADTPFSPQLILLRFLSIGRYIFLDTILFYLLGFIGLALLAGKYRLAPFSFLVLFLLFNFNGYITVHFAVGHSVWTGYFLIPMFIYLVLDLVEHRQVSWRWVLGLGLLLLLILLQGHFHLYLWCLMFLGVLALVNLRLFKPVALGGIFSVLLALPRLLPPSLAISGITQDFMGGFTTLTDLVFNLFMMRDPDRAVQLPSKIMPLSWWEVDYFVGLVGFAVLIIFGLLLPLRRSKEYDGAPPSYSSYHNIMVACLIFSAFSVGQVFAWVIRVIPIPPLTGERVTSRMFILPLAFLMVFSAIYLQRALEKRKLSPGVPFLAFGLAALLYHDLNQHLQAWRIRYLDGMVYLFRKVPFDAGAHTINNHADPLYTGLMVGGLAVALLALGFLLIMAGRERRANRPPASR